MFYGPPFPQTAVGQLGEAHSSPGTSALGPTLNNRAESSSPSGGGSFFFGLARPQGRRFEGLAPGFPAQSTWNATSTTPVGMRVTWRMSSPIVK